MPYPTEGSVLSVPPPEAFRCRFPQKFPLAFSVGVSTNNDDEEFLFIFVGQSF